MVALVALGIPLAGCGSGSSPPVSVSCTMTRLTAGMVRASLTITNSTSGPLDAIIYGPVFVKLRHFYPPTLSPAQVTVELPHGQTNYFGLVVPHVRPDAPSHVLLRFVRPQKGQTIAVAGDRRVQASDLHILDNPDCTLHP